VTKTIKEITRTRCIKTEQVLCRVYVSHNHHDNALN